MRGTFTVQRRHCVWWQKLFNWSLEIACVNAWGLYTGPMGRKRWTQELIRSLLGEDHARKKKLQPREQHWPVEMTKGRCAHCYKHDKTWYRVVSSMRVACVDVVHMLMNPPFCVARTTATPSKLSLSARFAPCASHHEWSPTVEP
eukprot:11417777-Ditylum_brightwellii.AAC.1